MTNTLNVPDLIRKKRDGLPFSESEIQQLIQAYTAGDIPDYQMSAWAMAVYLQGMTEAEATALTLAMAHSGQTVKFPGVKGHIVDKHSTGGVGDKVSLVLTPLVAAAGLRVAKLSGRGLGHTGGTIDKLESIPGFQASLSLDEMVDQVNRIGIALSESTHDLAPADKKLYGLRDVTATVGSLPLIASSIMSKKLAVQSDAIVLDVKVGSGALMKTLDQARALATLMVQIGNGAGRRTAALLTNMDQPLGYAIGNALEVKEAIQTLRGEGPPEFTKLCLALAAQLLVLAGQAASEGAAMSQLRSHIDDGSGFAQLKTWIEAQHGDASYIVDPTKFELAQQQVDVLTPQSGYIQSVDALAVGEAAHALGAGRTVKGEAIDFAVGVQLHKKTGDQAQKGEPLATMHINDAGRLSKAKSKLEQAFSISDAPVEQPVLIHETISP